jgi:branched-chain amino acid transport system substrate-binding protein
MFRLKEQMPDGAIIGGRGVNSVFADDTELNRWFQEEFSARYDTPPVYSAYHMAHAILGLKAAYDKAADGAGGQAPSEDQVIEAFENLTFETVGSTMEMRLGNGHQAVGATAYGTYRFDKESGQPTVVDVIRYPPECVNPPEGTTSVEWLEAGMPDAECG